MSWSKLRELKKKKKVKEDKKITLVETIKDISIKEVTMSMTLDE